VAKARNAIEETLTGSVGYVLPQRDSNWPTGTHENFRRGAALREFVSDVGRFGSPAAGIREAPGAAQFLSFVANGWQRQVTRGG